MRNHKIVFIVFLACFALIAQAQKNLVTDGEFLSGTERLNGEISKPGNNIWFGQTQSADPGEGFEVRNIDLKYRQKVMKAAFSDMKSRKTYLCQNVTGLKPNRNYLLGFWLKTNSPDAALRVEARGHNWENGQVVASKKMLGSLEVNSKKKNLKPGEWKYYTLFINTTDIDEELLGQKYVRLLFFFNQSFAGGKAVYHNPESGKSEYEIAGVRLTEGTDYVTNRDFERWDDTESPVVLTDWQTENGSVERAAGWKSDDFCARITADSHAEATFVSTPLRVPAPGKYKLTFWAMSEDNTVLKLGEKSFKLKNKWNSFTVPFEYGEQGDKLIFSIEKGKTVCIDQIILE